MESFKELVSEKNIKERHLDPNYYSNKNRFNYLGKPDIIGSNSNIVYYNNYFNNGDKQIKIYYNKWIYNNNDNKNSNNKFGTLQRRGLSGIQINKKYEQKKEEYKDIIDYNKKASFIQKQDNKIKTEKYSKRYIDNRHIYQDQYFKFDEKEIKDRLKPDHNINNNQKKDIYVRKFEKERNNNQSLKIVKQNINYNKFENGKQQKYNDLNPSKIKENYLKGCNNDNKREFKKNKDNETNIDNGNDNKKKYFKRMVNN